MKQIIKIIALLAINSLAHCWAVETFVPPGDGTLATAITAASSGDTLILQDGGYYGDVIVDKTIKIIAENRSTDAVYFGSMTIDVGNGDVIIQGLDFNQNLNLTSAQSIKILENYWAYGGILAGQYNTDDGDGSLKVIGNIFDYGNIENINSDNAYIAGNTLKSGWIKSSRSVWIVGNKITMFNEIYGRTVEINNAAYVRIIGNRIKCEKVYGITCISVSSPNSYISNNIIEVVDPAGYGYSYTTSGISASTATVVNNTIKGTTDAYNGLRRGSAITVGMSGLVAGNIVIDYLSPHSPSQAPINIGVSVEAINNLCFNTQNPCPEGNGNLNADPIFIDTVNYQLAANSPAINAGPSDYQYADLNRSRNDIGAYGGPWSIGQYDVQRDPNNLAPYVYPLFKGGAAYSDGTLDLQAIGVAKLR